MIMAMIRSLRSLLADLVFEMEKEVPYASALALETEGEKVTVETREQRAEPLHPERGVVFTVFTGRYFMEAATNDLRPGALKKTAKGLMAKAADSIRYDGLKVDPGEKLDKEFYVQRQIKNEDIPLAEKIDLCRRYQERLKTSDKRVISALYQYLFVRTRELFVNRHKSLYQDLKRTQTLAFVVMGDRGRAAQLHTGHAFQGGYEHAALCDEKLHKLISDCARILYADRLQPGYYDCIFSSSFAGMFAHEAFGHGMETDMFLKRRARGVEYIDRAVASPLVNMFDSPVLPGQAASFFFDHEGRLAGETQIIKDGVLKCGLTDLNSALRLNLTRTANGRRESFAHKVYARMTNTYFGPGRSSPEEMQQDISHGYLLEHPSNGMEDPKGWGIQLEGYCAEEIRDGRLTGKVYSPVIVTGYVPELLQSITMVGNKVEIAGLGMCGKGHKEWVKVTDGGPYLRLKARLG